MKAILSNGGISNGKKSEVQELRAAGKHVRSSRKSILRFLAATGMYTANGRLKPQFR